jgi:hypothetical protein
MCLVKLGPLALTLLGRGPEECLFLEPLALAEEAVFLVQLPAARGW